MSTVPTLFHTLQLSAWLDLEPAARREVADEVARRVGFSFTHFEPTTLGPVASFVDGTFGATFRLVPGGRFVMGWSAEEHARLAELLEGGDDEDAKTILGDRSWLPAHEVLVAPFLVAAEPLSDEALAKLLGRSDARSEDRCVAPSFIPQVDAALAALGLRHPSEAEWEYVARGATRSLFPGGVDAIPEEPGWPMTGFGAVRMAELPELCSDGVHGGYAGAPSDARPWIGEGRFVRGGSAMLFPWQGPNWWLSLCAARCALTDDDFFVAVRPVKSLFTDDEAYGESAVEASAAHERVEVIAAKRPKLSVPVNAPVEVAPRPRLPGFEDLPSTVLSTMYGKPVFDLVELVSVGLGGDEATSLLRDARKGRILSGFYSGETPGQIPVFLRLLGDARVPARHELAALLLDVILGDHAPKLPLLDWRRLGVAFVDRSMLALANAEPVLLSMLEDKDLRVRAGAAMLVATALQGVLGTQPLAAAYVRRDDPVLRANLAVAIGVAAHPTGSLPAGLPNADDPGTDHPLLAAALAIGHAAVARERTRPSVCDALVRALDVVVPPDTFFPWGHGDVLSLAARTLVLVGPRGVDALTAGLLDRVARPSSSPALRDAAARWLLELHLPYRSQRPVTMAEAEALGPLQRTIVLALSTDDAPNARYDERGLPLDAAARRALVRDRG